MHRYIPDSPGVSRPRWMNDEEWSEYRMTPEYAHEVSYVPDEPYGFDDIDQDRYDAMAEEEAVQREERLDAARREAEEIPLEELEAAAEMLDGLIQRRREECE